MGHVLEQIVIVQFLDSLSPNGRKRKRNDREEVIDRKLILFDQVFSDDLFRIVIGKSVLCYFEREISIAGSGHYQNTNIQISSILSTFFYAKISGERKEFFVAEKDMWEVVKKIIIQRKKKELEPILKMLGDINISEMDPKDLEEEEFVKVIKDLELYSNKIDNTFDTLINADSNWFVGTFMRMIR